MPNPQPVVPPSDDLRPTAGPRRQRLGRPQAIVACLLGAATVAIAHRLDWLTLSSGSSLELSAATGMSLTGATTAPLVGALVLAAGATAGCASLSRSKAAAVLLGLAGLLFIAAAIAAGRVGLSPADFVPPAPFARELRAAATPAVWVSVLVSAASAGYALACSLHVWRHPGPVGATPSAVPAAGSSPAALWREFDAGNDPTA